MSNAMNLGSVVVLKRLSSDPLIASSGAMYYNTTLNKVRIYENDTWHSVVSGIDVIDSIDTEVTARIAGDAELKLLIETNEQNRIQSEQTLKTELQSDYNQKIGAVDQKVAKEILDRAAADTTLDDKISAEVQNRINDDSTLQTNIDTEYAQRVAADAQLTTDLASEVLARAALDTRLTTDLGSETQARLAADDLKMDKAGGIFSGSVDMSGNAINNIPAATEGSQPATYAQLNAALNNIENSVGSRQSCKCFTNDIRLVEGVALSTILPFSDDEAPITIVIDDLVVGDYILADTNAPKLFKVIDDSGVKKATLVGVEQPVNGFNYFVAWDLVNTPANNENATLQGIRSGLILKVADYNFAYATGINLSATYAKALEKSAIQASDSIEVAVSKLEKNLEVAQSELQTALNDAIALEVSNRNSAIESVRSALQSSLDSEVANRAAAVSTAQTALQANIDAEVAARIAEDAKKLDLAGGTMTGDLNMGEKKITNVSVIEGKKVTTGVAPINGMQVTVGSFRFADGTRYDGSLVFTYRDDFKFGGKAFSYIGPNGWDIFHAAFLNADFSVDHGLLSIHDIDGNKVCEVTGPNYIIASWMNQDVANNNLEGYGAYGNNFTMIDSQSVVETPVAFSTGIDAGGKVVKNVGPAISDTDAINKAQLTSAINSVSGGAGASVAQEVSDRIAADTALKSELQTDYNAKFDLTASAQELFDEVAARTAADAALGARIDTEVATESATRISEDAKKLDLAGGMMTGDIDMNSKKLLNVSEISAPVVGGGAGAPAVTEDLRVISVRDLTTSFNYVLSGEIYPDSFASSDVKTDSYYKVGVDASGNVYTGSRSNQSWAGLLSNSTQGTFAYGSPTHPETNTYEFTCQGGYVFTVTGLDVGVATPFSVVWASAGTPSALVIKAASLSLDGKIIKDVADAVNGKDAVNKDVLDSEVAILNGKVSDEVAARTAADTKFTNDINKLDAVANKTIVPVALEASSTLKTITALSFTSAESISKSIKYQLVDTITNSSRFGTLMVTLGGGNEVGQYDNYVSSNGSMDDIELVAVNNNGACTINYIGTANPCILKIMAIVIAS